MLIRIATLPFRAVRKVVRAFTGGGTPPPPPRPADAWELRQAREARGIAQPAPRAPEDPGRAHSHDHGHGHSHDHASGPPPQVRVGETPNPAARKFTLDRPLQDPSSRSYQSPTEAEADPLATALFGIPGVRAVFAVDDFVTVTAEAATDWDRLSPAIVAALQAGGA